MRREIFVVLLGIVEKDSSSKKKSARREREELNLDMSLIYIIESEGLIPRNHHVPEVLKMKSNN